MLAVVLPGSTTMVYNCEANLAVSNRQYTNVIGGGASEYCWNNGSGQSSTHFGGYRLVARNIIRVLGLVLLDSL